MEASTISPTDRSNTGFVDVFEYGTHGRPAWADIDWRPNLKQIELEGRRLNFLQLGDPGSPTVILIHGLSGAWQNWLENVQALASEFHVIAPDLPGFGESELPLEPVSIHGYARTIIALMDALGIEKASLVGNSMGGQTAAQVALDEPHRVEKLILVSPVGYSTSTAPSAITRGAAPLALIMSRVGARSESIAKRPGLRKAFLMSVAAHPEKLRPEIVYELIGGTGKVGFVAAVQAIFAHDLREQLGGITAPTLIIWGQKDRLITSRDAHRFADKIAGSIKLIVRDTGHLTMVERPDWFNETARDFILS
ncbi:MAG: alpha/beta fold hydrolase [Solirubrobacterales bacterium]